MSFNFMAYKLTITPEQMKDLWRLREFCGAGPIISQVKTAIDSYLREKQKELGSDIKDISEAVERAGRESG